MKKAFIFLFFLMAFKFANAQIKIWDHHDVNGKSLNGYYDPLVYAPDKKISVINSSESYEVGHYNDTNGNKVNGLIKFKGNKIWFRKGKKENLKKIIPENIETFVIGVDSFFSVSNYYYKDKLITKKPTYVQYISSFNEYTFAKHYYFNQDEIGKQPPPIETYLLKSKNTDIWVNFSNKNMFKENALKYFGYIPDLKKKISSGYYKSKDMLSIIKMAEYYHKFKNDKPILYNKYWQEVRTIDKAVYRAKIKRKIKSIWTFEYYKDSIKLYQANYTSFYPNKKEGDFISFYPNGKIRQTNYYIYNKPTEVKTFNKKGLLTKHYDIIEDVNNDPSEVKTFNKKGLFPKHYDIIEGTNNDPSLSKTDIKYFVVNDTLMRNILKDNNRKSYEIINNEFNGYTYTNVYKKETLTTRYRVKDRDTVFQITDPNYDFKIKSLQQRFIRFIDKKTYDIALSEDAQGTILVSLIIDPKGFVLESTILNKIHPEIDDLIDSFIRSRLLDGAKFRHKFKPYIKDNIKRYCEVLMPFEFATHRFYRKPTSYNHFNNWSFDMMMFHLQIMDNFTLPVMPNLNKRRGF